VDQLEELQWYIYSVPGKGSFASGSAGADEARRKELMARARELLAELKYLGVSEEELAALVREEPKMPGAAEQKRGGGQQ